MILKRSTEILADEIKNFGKRSNWEKFPTESEKFLGNGRESETEGEMHHFLRGMDAPADGERFPGNVACFKKG